MSPLVLILDQGGHSTRALVFDGAGALVAQASQAINTVTRQPGWIEQDAADIVASLHAVLAQVANQLGVRCQHLSAAGLIVQRSSLVAWNRLSLQPLSPVLSWQDTRHSAWLDDILVGKRDVIRDKTGLYPNAHYGASKIRWLLDNVPAVKNAAENHVLCIAPLASFLQQQLTHPVEPVVDAVIASRTMLTEISAMTWSPALLDLFGIPLAILPVIMPTLADYGDLRVGNCNVPLRLLGGDQSFFAVSHGILFSEDVVFINAGTGAFIQQKMPAASVPNAMLCAPLLIAEDPANNIVVAEGTVNAAASALDWFWQRIGLTFSTGDWLAAIAQADRDPDSVPYFINRVTATGSPDWLPAAEPVFSKPSSTGLEAVAVLEAIVFALQRNLDCLNQVQGCGKIVLSGGLSKLDIFCQCLADVTEKIVLRCDDVEACARGAAMQLLPEMVSGSDYREYIPCGNPAQRQRYRQWSAAMDLLSSTG
jgi:glycerol kinase